MIAYVRAIEEALIRACAEAGVTTTRVDGRSGVWVRRLRPRRRPGPQGRRDRHPGIARGDHARVRAQLRPDLGWFDRIVPCGIRDAGVTTLSAETGRQVTVADADRARSSVISPRCSAPARWRSRCGQRRLSSVATLPMPAASTAAAVLRLAGLPGLTGRSSSASTLAERRYRAGRARSDRDSSPMLRR